MGKPTVIPVETLSGFAATIEDQLAQTKNRNPDIATSMNWYRGHSSSVSHRLRPSLYRHPNIKEILPLLQLEARMMDSFKRQGMLHSFQAAPNGSGTLMMQMFYMQHHGVPTRLLDWTSNPFIALYFALSDAKRKKNGNYGQAAAVWVLDPYSWNRRALEDLAWADNGPADSEDVNIQSYHPLHKYSAAEADAMYPWPIALVGAANTPRMLAQKGVFTIFGRNTGAMETIYNEQAFPADCLVKLEVPADKIGPMLEVLVAVGYTDSVAYPDLQGLAMEIKRFNGYLP